MRVKIWHCLSGVGSGVQDDTHPGGFQPQSARDFRAREKQGACEFPVGGREIEDVVSGPFWYHQRENRRLRVAVVKRDHVIVFVVNKRTVSKVEKLFQVNVSFL